MAYWNGTAPILSVRHMFVVCVVDRITFRYLFDVSVCACLLWVSLASTADCSAVEFKITERCCCVLIECES